MPSLCVLLLALAVSPIDAEPERTVSAAPFAAAPVAAASAADASGPWFSWVVRFALEEAASYALGYVLDRNRVRRQVEEAVANLDQVRRLEGLSQRNRSDISETQSALRTVAAELGAGQRMNADRIRAVAQALGAVEARQERILAAVGRLDRRLSRVEGALQRLEAQQRRQLRMIMDLERRQAVTERRVMELDGEIVRLDQSVAALTARVDEHRAQIDALEARQSEDEANIALLFRITARHGDEIADLRELIDQIMARINRRYYDRHVMTFGLTGYAAGFYGSGATGGPGAGGTFSYTFTERSGMFLDVAFLTVRPSLDAPTGDEVWDNVGVFSGVRLQPTPPTWQVAARLKLGGGFVWHTLSSTTGQGAFASRNAIDSETKLAGLVGLEFGFAPALHGVEFVVEGASAILASPLEDAQFFDTDSRFLTYGGVGVRYRLTQRATLSLE